MTIWIQYLENVSDFMNVTANEAGIISSLIVTIGLLIVVLIATRGASALVTIPVSSFFSIIFFTFIGWFPIWTGSVIALVLVIFIGFVFSKFVGG